MKLHRGLKTRTIRRTLAPGHVDVDAVTNVQDFTVNPVLFWCGFQHQARHVAAAAGADGGDGSAGDSRWAPRRRGRLRTMKPVVSATCSQAILCRLHAPQSTAIVVKVGSLRSVAA